VTPSALRVGLTGGIASGKSVVARRLQEHGLATIDLDGIAHALMAPGGAAYEEVRAAFGAGVLDASGGIDRRALGQRVFADEGARRRLERIVHPRVREAEARAAAAFAAEPGRVVVTHAALLVEAGQHLRYDRLVVTHCPPEVQVRRLRERDGIDAEAARVRLSAQLPVDEKRRFAHLEVDTGGSLAETEAQADALAARLGALAAEPPPRPLLHRPRVLGSLEYGARRGPRGLDPLKLARAIREADATLEDLGRLLEPPAPGPWYRAARAEEGPPGPEVLSAVVALWSAGRRGADTEPLLAAAASLARLTHRNPEAVGTTCVLALAFLAAWQGVALRDLPGRLEAWRESARRWAGGPFPDRLAPVLAAAAAHAGDVPGARAASGGAGVDADLAAALAGLEAGPPTGGWSGEVVAAAQTLLGASGDG
jgi:dephospho-CoA kinase